jgi:PAS domain S-box-containing protein
MFVLAIWSGGNALEMSGLDLATKLFWANFQYFAYCFSPLALIALCMRFTGYDKWLRTKAFWWLLVFPAVIFMLVWTDGYHGLMRYNIQLDTSGALPVITKSYGPAFYIHTAHVYLINTTALIILINATVRRKTVYRKQAVILLIGVMLIILPNVLYILGLSPARNIDLTPVSFGPAGALMAFAIFRYKMFDLVPLARATVIETMDAGVLVLDLQSRILDINPALEKMTGVSAKLANGRSAADAFGAISEFSDACTNRNVTHTEFHIAESANTKIYEAILSPLTDSKGSLLGRLAMVYEITEKKKVQQKYLVQQRRLAASREKEQMARDLHDNLGQILGFINLQAQGIQRELTVSGVGMVNDQLKRLVEVTQTAHEQLRSYIKSARNVSASDNNLIASLRTDILRFEERSGISTELNVNLDLTDFSTHTQLHLLSIAREALYNVQKHSGASHVRLTALIENSHLSLIVEDDGRGFDPMYNRTDEAFGLSIMQERAAEIGAELHIETAPEKGCRVRLTKPVHGGEKT